MFTKEEVSRRRQEFWTAFGKYMNPVPSSEGLKISWLNYHTGVKHLFFRMDAGLKSASIFISIEDPDPSIREEQYQIFVQHKKMLRSALGEQWKWEAEFPADQKTVSRISKSLPAKSVMIRDDWPDLISFFKQRIIGLDAFWENARHLF